MVLTLETERRSAGVTDRYWPLVDGLAVFALVVVDVEARENVKDLGARVEGVLAQERIGTNTDSTADLLVSVSIGEEANDVNGRPSDPLGVQ